MLIAIPDVLDAAAVARVRAIVDAGEWVDGNATSGPQAALAKRNAQLAEGGAADESPVSVYNLEFQNSVLNKEDVDAMFSDTPCHAGSAALDHGTYCSITGCGHSLYEKPCFR